MSLDRAATPARATSESQSFARLSARRLLSLGGIGLILAGMLFGDIFAVFVLHQNASRVGVSLSQAVHASLLGDVPAVHSAFADVGGFLENRGTKVDAHVHMIDFGYLALMLALMQPWMALSETRKRKLAWLFLSGATLLPVGVFLIHYVGLASSPLKAIGWASIFADLGGLFVLAATAAYFIGLLKHLRRQDSKAARDDLLHETSTTGRILLSGGLLLVLIGFAHGAYYAASDLYRHEAADYAILSQMADGATSHSPRAIDYALASYGELQADKAVKMAAHAHVTEFGMLAMILAFFQPYVALREAWKRRWAFILLLGSIMLPAFVLMELRLGLLAGGLADLGGLLVILSLLAMWIGILRYTGHLDFTGGDIA